MHQRCVLHLFETKHISDVDDIAVPQKSQGSGGGSVFVLELCMERRRLHRSSRANMI